MQKSNKHAKYLEFLTDVASESEAVSRCRVSAMLVHKNFPITIGTNKMKSHPLQRRYSSNDQAIYLHAEIDAITKALRIMSVKELQKCTLYVCRVLKDGSCAIARPCSGCQKAIKAFGIKEVIWSIDNNKFSSTNEEILNDDYKSYDLRRKKNRQKIHNINKINA